MVRHFLVWSQASQARAGLCLTPHGVVKNFWAESEPLGLWEAAVLLLWLNFFVALSPSAFCLVLSVCRISCRLTLQAKLLPLTFAVTWLKADVVLSGTVWRCCPVIHLLYSEKPQPREAESLMPVTLRRARVSAQACGSPSPQDRVSDFFFFFFLWTKRLIQY